MKCFFFKLDLVFGTNSSRKKISTRTGTTLREYQKAKPFRWLRKFVFLYQNGPTSLSDFILDARKSTRKLNRSVGWKNVFALIKTVKFLVFIGRAWIDRFPCFWRWCWRHVRSLPESVLKWPTESFEMKLSDF